jgi:cell division protein FtsQ
MSELLDRADSSTTPPPEERTRRRFLRRARDRRRRVLRRVLLAVLVLGVAGGLVWLVFFSSVLAVKGTQVDGVSVLTARQVERAAQVPTGVPLATVDLGAIEARVEDLAPVLDADVSRSWPDQVRITVTERTAVVAVQRDGVWKGVDADGVVFRSFKQRPTDLPVVEMKADTSSEVLAEAAHVVRSLPSDILSRVTTLDVRSIDSIVLNLRGGATVSWGSADQAEDKARVLEVLLRQKGTAYDVTAPGRPTIRP